jgi:cell division protein FtsW
MERESASLSARSTRPRRKHDVPASIMVPRLMLLGSVILLLVIGLVMVYSASSIEAYSEFGDSAYFLKKQAIMLVVGLGIGGALALFPYQRWRGLPIWIFWIVVVSLLVLTTLFGYVGLGSKRWLYIFGQGFQPSEFAKVAVLMMAAHLFVLQRTGNYPRSFRRFTLTMALTAFLPAIIIFIQPDLGTFLIVVFGIFAVMWFGEVPWKAVVIIIVAVVAIGIFAIAFESFRSTRISSWLDPWSDPLDTGYQIINSFYAFSDGGIFGVGLGNSLQKYLYLPEAYNDFIFAILGEETGLVGCLVVISLFVVLFIASLRIGKRATDGFGAILAPACGASLIFQALLNICCVTGLFPITGKPLPFISYGGTSLITSLMLVGVILSVSLHTEQVDYEQRRDGLLVTVGGAGSGSRAAPAAIPAEEKTRPHRLDAPSRRASSRTHDHDEEKDKRSGRRTASSKRTSSSSAPRKSSSSASGRRSADPERSDRSRPEARRSRTDTERSSAGSSSRRSRDTRSHDRDADTTRRREDRNSRRPRG